VFLELYSSRSAGTKFGLVLFGPTKVLLVWQAGKDSGEQIE